MFVRVNDGLRPVRESSSNSCLMRVQFKHYARMLTSLALAVGKHSTNGDCIPDPAESRDRIMKYTHAHDRRHHAFHASEDLQCQC